MMSVFQTHGGVFMANADTPNGLLPVGPVLRIQQYEAGSAIYPGDPVALASDGQIDRSAGPALIGVALSYASAAGVKVLVADHPDQMFEIQSDDSSIDAQTDMFQNYDIALGSADTTYKKSQAELDGDTNSATATVALKLLRIMPRVNNALGANVKCVVKLNNHQLAGGTGTAGV